MFWKNFFKNSQLFTSSISNSQNNNKKILIIRQCIEYKGKPVQLVFSMDKSVNIREYHQLCESVGWECPSIQKIYTAIQNSFLILSLFYKKQETIQLIGFARVTSDQVFNAVIWDIVIHPNFQGQGLGKILIYHILDQLRSKNIVNIGLFADASVVSFYSNLGFIKDPNGIKGMFWFPVD
uniref:GCN5-like N-acetyltransferase n=1 Tax=Dixoniella grisea TaxID=35153 RepID=UPI001FCE1C15|nr:GCN5-like N-acetyltransferase [Dixoniella grisea]UNJ17073.1 GCN5-like N-acetyltransferase [Dixoniella grisea]